MKTLNFFVIDSILQYFIVGQILNNFSNFKNEDNIIYITNNTVNESFKLENFGKIIKINNDLTGNNLLKRSNTINKELNLLEQIFVDYDKINLFMATLYKWNNILYNHFVKNDEKFTYINYPDGNDSLFFKKVDKKELAMRRIKCFICKLFNIDYCWNDVFKEDYLGISLANKIYSYFSELLECKFNKSIIKIPMQKLIKNTDKESIIIFLGQVVEGGMKENFYNKIDECFKYVSEQEQKRIYYKKHPREDVKLIEPLLKKYDFRIFEDERAIEEVIIENKYNVEKVYSYYSSGLINLKLILGDNIKCIAYKGLKYYKINSDNAERLLSLYERLGVEYVH